ncbi:MAG: tRNA uridine-5-carboxymethylaminomethyl(34) synthesis GTPase MnmE [Oscillospiraceae bacterium]|nr:tRNA uridine-5-carboxymethylaminomethyl(34) synthesis GTPase MnmE [Oscillospiraceae bacterium]
MNLNSTVAAISTPHAAGGISVIRISGEKALEIADMVFSSASGKKPSHMDGYTCAYGIYHDENNNRIDDGIVSVFRAPKSYTGENVAELSCHGGIFVTEKLLQQIYSCGAAPAQAGEFTKRAFLNGKMNLTQAEAVMDIISAEGEAYHKCASALREGRLFKKISAVSDKLIHLLGEIAAWVDYPEDDIPEVDDENLKNTVNEIYSELKAISETYRYGKIIREGIDTAIVGKPNVGKSTLMNLLAGCERSIVTDIAGTTRDIVEESVRLGDIVLRVSDTAGIRSTDDIIEGIGVERAVDRIKNAELVLAVFDGSSALDDDDLGMIEKCSQCKNKIALVNKSDKEKLLDIGKISSAFDDIIEISAKNGEGIEKLTKLLYNKYIGVLDAQDNVTVANERQKKCLDNAIKAMGEAVDAVAFGMTTDAVNIVLDEAENYLLELTGERTSEAVVNEVFSHFCVGK